MTYASELTRQHQRLDAVLVIDGVPTLFGTRAGRVHDGSGVTGPPAAWTSVAAIIPESIKLGAQEMDWDSMFVKPAKVSLSIAASPAWNRYFERRRTTPSTLLTASVAAADGSASVVSTAAFADGYVYIDRETIYAEVFDSTTFTLTQRPAIGLSGERAASHTGGAGYMATVSSYPTYLIGRQCALRIFAGEGDAAFQDLVGLRISESPKFNAEAGTWDLTFDDGMSLFARKIATGFRGMTNAAAADAQVAGVDTIGFTMPTPYELSSAGDEIGHVLVTPPQGGVAGDEPYLCKLNSIGAGPLYLATVNKSALIGRENLGNIGSVEMAGSTLRRCCVFNDYPMQCVLKILLSGNGDGTNDATWDVLPGMTAEGVIADGAYQFCMGANIHAGLIDVATLDDFIYRTSDGWTYILGARGEEQLLDVLEECAWALGGFFYIASTGKLSFREWTAVYATETANYTLTEDHILQTSPKNAVDDESTILHTVTMRTNFMPDSGDSNRAVTVAHQEVKSLYRDTPVSQSGTLTLERKATWVEGALVYPLGNAAISVTSPSSIKQQLARIFNKRSAGTRRYTLTLPWRYSPIVPGDRLNVTHTLLNAFDGSYVNGMTFDVVGVGRNFNEATITVKLDETFAGKRIAPMLRVTAYAANTPGAGQSTFTLEVDNTTWGGGSSPASYFPAGWTFKVHDRSSSPMFSTTSTMTVTGGNGTTTLVCNSNAGFAVAVGDVVQFDSYDSAAATNVNTQSIAQHDYAFLSDATFTLGAAGDVAGRWG